MTSKRAGFIGERASDSEILYNSAVLNDLNTALHSSKGGRALILLLTIRHKSKLHFFLLLISLKGQGWWGASASRKMSSVCLQGSITGCFSGHFCCDSTTSGLKLEHGPYLKRKTLQLSQRDVSCYK